MTALEILRAARALISKPERWTQGSNARNPRTKRRVSVRSPLAGQFCAVGSMDRVFNGSLPRFERWNAGAALSEMIAPFSLSDFNDTHTHPEVLALFDRAIARLEAQCP